MSLFKKIAYTLIVLLAGTIGFQEAKAQTIDPGECEISDIYFEPRTNLTENSEITLHIAQGHPDCAIDKTEFNLKIREEGGGGFDWDDDIYDEGHNFHTNGEPFKLTFIPHNSECDDSEDGCRYFVEVLLKNRKGTRPAHSGEGAIITSNDILYSSDYDSGDITTNFFSDEVKLERARFVIPCYEDCEKGKIEIISATNDNADDQQKCRVESAVFNPNGDQTDPNFLDPNQQPPLNLKVTMKDCVGSEESQKVMIEIVTKSGSTFNVNEAVESVNVSGLVPDDGIIDITYTPGDEECDENVDGRGYCNYGIRVYDSLSTLNGKVIFESPNGSVDGVTSKIGFYCFEECKDDEWEVRRHNLEKVKTSDKLETVGVSKKYDTSDPCYFSDGTTQGYRSDCYEPLVSFPGAEDTIYKTVEGTGRQYIDFSTFQLGDYINFLFKIALGVLMVLAVIMIIIAGVQYMTVESIYGKSDARSRITNAVTGLLVALGIFLILSTINPKLLDVNFTAPSAKISFNQLDEKQLEFINSTNTAGVVTPPLPEILEYEPLIGYLYHQQGPGGAPSILWAAKNGYANVPNTTPFMKDSSSVQKNIDAQYKTHMTPKDFIEKFYKVLKVKEGKIDTITPNSNALAVERAANEVGVDVNVLKTICMIESYDCSKAEVVNSYGYTGLFQFHPEKSWPDWRKNSSAKITDAYDNAYAGAKFLKYNLSKYQTDKEKIN